MSFTKGIPSAFVVGFVGVLYNCALLGSEAKEKEDAAKTEVALVTYWSFDEGDGTTARDKSGNGHDAIFMPGREPKWFEGFIGKAFEFKQSGEGIVADMSEQVKMQSMCSQKNLFMKQLINEKATANAVLLKDGEEEMWKRELLPLPQELSIEQVLHLNPDDILVKGRSGASWLERESVDRIVQLFRGKTGVAPKGNGFTILIGLIDEQNRIEAIEVPLAERLKRVPNHDQAYVIQPVSENMLVVTALTDRGLYYGTRTLAQWLEFHLTQDSAEIPLATVVDWPDLAERGFWHMPVSLIPWLAEMKVNRFFDLHNFEVDSNGIHPTSKYNEPNEELRREWTPPYEKARMFAAEVVPGPTHMDFWEARCKGYKEHFPALIGKGEAAKNPFMFPRWPQRAPCASNPDMVKILVAVMAELAKQKAAEIMVWASEYPETRCECPNCVHEGQFRAEIRAALTAWQEVKKSYPDLKLSVFFGRGGFLPPPERHYPDKEIADIVAGLPPNVIMRVSMGCDGSDGKLLKNFAVKGKRISRMYVVYDLAGYFSRDILLRIHDISSGKYIGAWQITSRAHNNSEHLKKLHNYRLSALAEYYWNANGRSEKEFAECWAVRNSVRKPDEFVKWIETVSIPQASRMMVCTPGAMFDSWFGNLKNMIDQRKWDETYFKAEELETGLKQSKHGLALAEKLGEEDFIQYARTLLEYCRLEQTGYRFISSLGNTALKEAAKEKAIDKDLARLKKVLKNYVSARNAISFDSSSSLGEKLPLSIIP